MLIGIRAGSVSKYRPSANDWDGSTRRGRADEAVDERVTFVDADHDIDDEVDAAYRAKYHRYAGRILKVC
jgi:uncharacterized protein DUF2255